jgi:hypothetical protein
MAMGAAALRLIAEKHPFLRVGNKLLVLHAGNSSFLKREKPAWTLIETAENSRFQLHQKNAVIPTVGFIFSGRPW